jgi:hypothetical protein
MDGDIGPLPGLCDVAEKYGAIMMVDDAHASGVLGRNGRGTIDHFKVHGRVDIQVGTLSKAIGALGGYVCGTRDLIDFLYHRARPFLVFDVASAVGRGHLHRGLRRSGKRTRAHGKTLGEHSLLEKRTGPARLRHRRHKPLPPAKLRSPQSSSATASSPWTSRANSSKKACSAPASRFRRCPKAKPASAPS